MSETGMSEAVLPVDVAANRENVFLMMLSTNWLLHLKRQMGLLLPVRFIMLLQMRH